MQVLAKPFTAAALFIAASATAAHAIDAPIIVQAKGGPILITPIFHASMQIDYRGKTIQVDPFSQGDYTRAAKADILLITHTHSDHFDPDAIKRVSNHSTRIVAPKAVTDQLAEKGINNPEVTTLGNGQLVKFLLTSAQGQSFTIYIRAVPAYNVVRERAPGQKYHPKGQFNGYVLNLDGKRIYVAGDTEITPEMKQMRGLDLAFLPMNLPYTMTPLEAAAGVRVFAPKMAAPYHYRSPFDKPNDNPLQFKNALQGSGTRVVLRDWYRK